MSDWDSGWFGESADDTDAWYGMGSDWSAEGDFDSAPSWASTSSAWERIDISADNPEATGYDVFKDAESGKLLTITPSGQYWISDPSSTTDKPIKIWDSGALERASPGLGTFIGQFAKNLFVKDGKPNVPGILGLTAFLNSGMGKRLLGTGEAPKVGYQGGIPKYEAVRERVNAPYDPDRRPGSGGQRYFSDTKYVDPTKTDELAAAKAAAAEQASGLAALNKANPAYETKPKVEAKKEEPAAAPTGLAAMPASAVASTVKVPQYDEQGQVIAAGGGLMNLAKGRYLNGSTDGMADKIPANIEGKQPAKLSHGEFVIPADVVSHLGNGNSEAGAKRLYDMMDKIRHARTGTTKQGKQINPNKYLPA